MSALALAPRPGLKWGRFARISKGDPDELGRARQLKVCGDLIERIDPQGEVIDDYTEVVSAFDRRKRSKRLDFLRLLADIRARRINAVAIYNVDRLIRDDLRGIEDLIDVLEHYGVTVAAPAGDFDISTSHGRAQVRSAGVWARLESERMSERIRAKHQQLAGDGHPNGGNRPYGFAADRVSHDPIEAPRVAEMVSRVAAGETLSAITADFNARQVPTARGKRWTVANLSRVVRNPRYIGRRLHQGVDVGSAVWEAVVDQATWQRAQALLGDPSRQERRTARRNLLTGGLLVCGRCGKRLYGKPVAGVGRIPAHTYTCHKPHGGCGRVSGRVNPVEAVVVERLFDLVEDPRLARELHRRHSGDHTAAARVEKLRAELDQLSVQFDDEVLDPAEYVRMRDKRRAQLAEATEALTAQTSASAVGRYAGRKGLLRAEWATLSLDQRQAILRSVLERVTLAPHDPAKPHNTFDASRLTFDWLY